MATVQVAAAAVRSFAAGEDLRHGRGVHHREGGAGLDFAILCQLQNNARLRNGELAWRVGLAPSTTLVRTRQLERAGILRGYRAEIDSDALRDFALDALTTRSEVAHLETGLIFSCFEPGTE